MITLTLMIQEGLRSFSKSFLRASANWARAERWELNSEQDKVPVPSSPRSLLPQSSLRRDGRVCFLLKRDQSTQPWVFTAWGCGSGAGVVDWVHTEEQMGSLTQET